MFAKSKAHEPSQLRPAIWTKALRGAARAFTRARLSLNASPAAHFCKPWPPEELAHDRIARRGDRRHSAALGLHS